MFIQRRRIGVTKLSNGHKEDMQRMSMVLLRISQGGKKWGE